MKNIEKSHSITLDLEKCKGCTNCIKQCPTEAIRVTNGQAYILDERCIDCAQCVRTCPFQAKLAQSDPLSMIEDFPQSIALVAPSFYGQFPGSITINQILTAVKSLGFDDVFEVAQGADLASAETEVFLRKPSRPQPAITSSCPVVVRLIQNRFPSLLENLIPLVSPMEITGQIGRSYFAHKKVGVFFISPCSGKVTAVRTPRGLSASRIDGVIGFKDIYGKVKKALTTQVGCEPLASASGKGRRWAKVGGEGEASSNHFISVDGINRVIEGLEQLENGNWDRFELVEFMCCPGGCMGGPLTVVNSYEGAANIKERERLTSHQSKDLRPLKIPSLTLKWDREVEAQSVYQLDSDYGKALALMEKMEEIIDQLPGIDCGSCGAPSCKAFAEDVVLKRANMTDCVFILRERIKGLTNEMVDLQQVMPPSFKKKIED